MSSLFVFKTPHNQNIKHYRRQKGRVTLNAFAERLARGDTIAAACIHVGVGRNAGTMMFRKMCQELGSQAQ